MGIIQLVTGALTIIFSEVGLSIGTVKKMKLKYAGGEFSLSGGGIWAGPFFIGASIS
ncbi:hypothetical protein BOX15_Mlig001419g3 [Macrostomum lignano]|uniref:Uncharacterized protein n=1 Tax=Macrostomum lignano TaxID=282301 RepID=A0A267EDA2_9PLAT|nr:hypothetical protein BOX15_Mlig001419g3 [Macrostomum lignano]